MAGDPHHDHVEPLPTIIINEKTLETRYVQPETDYRGTSLGMSAGQCKYRFSGNEWRRCIAGAYYDDAGSAWIGAAKPVCANGCNNNIMSFGVGIENDEIGFAGGFTF